MKKKSVLITGCSSGLGLALCKVYLKKGYTVYGIARNNPKIKNKDFIFKKCDLSKIDTIKSKLKPFFKTLPKLQFVYLNAGTLGPIQSMQKLTSKEIQKTLDLNVFANKELLDMLCQHQVKHIIAISSGAAVNGSFGWGGYSLSKASLNMLINLYAKEMLDTHLLAIAPGVIETPMTDIIRFELDDTQFPSAKILKNGIIQTPKEAAKKLFQLNNQLKNFSSGDFIDIRKI